MERRPQFSTISISWTPADVSVSDERGTVPGARVEVRGIDTIASGFVIPPEGDRVSAWVDDDLFDEPAGVEWGEWVKALAEAAESGADGRNGSIELVAG